MKVHFRQERHVDDRCSCIISCYQGYWKQFGAIIINNNLGPYWNDFFNNDKMITLYTGSRRTQIMPGCEFVLYFFSKMPF